LSVTGRSSGSGGRYLAIYFIGPRRKSAGMVHDGFALQVNERASLHEQPLAHTNTQTSSIMANT
jgi:hypothetical protein